MRSATQSETGYQSYWDRVGTDFPSLKGAPSTAYYAECEQRLIRDLLGPLEGKSLFKTDLWDEAKNTEILKWASEQGARVAGLDISLAVVAEARRVLGDARPLVVGADLRAIPYRDASFDLVYSMGTIEHFHDHHTAVAEIFRVLKPGGRAIIGVPNLLDPFLRPLMVAILDLFGAYDYGLEKAFTPRGLRRELERAGFRWLGHSGILFMPGWLRMADLLFHTRGSGLTRLPGALTRPYARLARRFPAMRRHGYLIAGLVERPRSS